MPGAYYQELNPGVANSAHSPLASDLGRDDFLILSSRWNTLAGQTSAPPLGPAAPNDVVAAGFRPVRTAGPWTLYERASSSG